MLTTSGYMIYRMRVLMAGDCRDPSMGKTKQTTPFSPASQFPLAPTSRYEKKHYATSTPIPVLLYRYS